ncbi:hypothetical protein [Ferriphaselus sp. R-1]|uniref:hypothetical protein n=1 Tax=Ferriphaselus sp. R-1 TaxID=1485544 RepID=UPI000550A0AC|nr:hypothetical protein [Ferriphaselus sp. R-1]
MPRESLWPFLTFDGLSDSDLINAYRKVYLETYVQAPDGQRVMLHDWTGAHVNFPPWQFDHAFSKTSQYREGLDHDTFSLERAKRMLWIREVIQATNGTVFRYVGTRQSGRGRQVKRRSFLVHEENYLVVLNDPDAEGKPFQFITAYPVYDLDYLKRIRRENTLLEERRA